MIARMAKVRFVKLVVLPVAVIDDGENLHELEINQLEVPADEIDNFAKSGLRQALDKLLEAEVAVS